jgi:alpha-1,2-mannosyltransferase
MSAPLADPRRRRTALVLAAGLTVGFGLLQPVLLAVTDQNDFNSFWRAGRSVLAERLLRSDSGVDRYPPVFELLHAPLGALPLGVAAGLWYALSVAALCGLPRQLERLSGIPPREQWPAFAVMAVIALDNLKLGQSAPVLLWLTSWGAARARAGGALVGGVAIGAAALLKVIPAATLAAPVILGRARGALAGFALAVILGFAATAAWVGPGATLSATREWMSDLRADSPWSLVERRRSLRYNNQGVGVTLARSFGAVDARSAKGVVRLASWSWPQVWTLYGLLLAAAFVLGGCAALGARRRTDAGVWLDLYALSALCMLLAAPIVWTHYFLWMLPALLTLRGRPRLLLWGGIAFNAALAVPPLRALGFHMACALALYAWIASGLCRSLRAAPRVQAAS